MAQKERLEIRSVTERANIMLLLFPVAPLDCLGYLQGAADKTTNPAPRKTYIAPHTFFNRGK